MPMNNDSRISAPWFLRWTGGLLHETPAEVDNQADMLALFVCAGLTVLGVLGGAVLRLYLAPPNRPGFPWIVGLLICSG